MPWSNQMPGLKFSVRLIKESIIIDAKFMLRYSIIVKLCLLLYHPLYFKGLPMQIRHLDNTMLTRTKPICYMPSKVARCISPVREITYTICAATQDLNSVPTIIYCSPGGHANFLPSLLVPASISCT